MLDSYTSLVAYHIILVFPIFRRLAASAVINGGARLEGFTRLIGFADCEVSE
jgi:hypothetical protein